MTESATASEELGRFLGEKRQKVLVCQGPWGIGKTYFWKKFIAENRKLAGEAVYSYVSLFGVGDVGQLKNRIILNAKTEAGSGKLWLARWGNKVTRWTQGVDIPILAQSQQVAANVLSNVQEVLIKKWLICFDDLERKLPALHMTEFLGLVSALRDEQDCRVVLIFNEGALNDEDKSEFQKYREKVIDAVFTYRPSLRQNVQLVFSNGDVDMVERVFASASVNNIRVVQQCAWALGYFDRYLEEFHERVQTAFRCQVVKMAVLNYAFADQVSLDELGGTSWALLSLQEEHEKPRSATLLENMEFSAQEYDRYIADYLTNGYCDTAGLRDVLGIQDKNVRLEAPVREMHSIYDLLNNNFQAGPADVAKRALDVLGKHGPDIAWRELVQLTDFLPKVEPHTDWDGYAKRLLTGAVANASETSLARLKQYSKWPEMTEAISKREGEFASKLDIESLIYALAGTEGWTPANYAKLDQFTVDELVAFISKSSRSDLIHLLRELLRRAAVDQSEPAAPRVLEKVKAALLQIGERNELNKWRVDHVLKILES